jgi:hypothetical protein
LKAIYYLIEKRLKQGLQFPDPDFNGLLALDPSAHSQHHHHYSLIRTKSRSMQNNENQQQQQRQQQQPQHYNNGATVISSGGGQIHSSLSQHQSSASTTATNGTNGSHHHHGLVKQNSQLLPKRQHMTGAHLATRSSSQKNVDFKSILSNLNNTTGNGNHRLSFTQMNSNGNINGHSSYKENNNGVNNHHVIINHHDNNSVGDSNSPSPDFIAAAMSPIKVSTGNANGNNIGSSTVSLSRNSRQTNYQVITKK